MSFRPYQKSDQLHKNDIRKDGEESAEKNTYENADLKPEKKEKLPRPRLKRSSIKRKAEPTGELAMFREIVLKRGARSEISGDRINEITVSSMAHILAKKQYPKFRLKEENICIMTPEEHRRYDQGLHEALRVLPEWEWLFKKRDMLIGLYKFVV